MKKFIFILILMFVCVINVNAEGTKKDNPNVTDTEDVKTCYIMGDVVIKYNKGGQIITIYTLSDDDKLYVSDTLWTETFAEISSGECPYIYWCDIYGKFHDEDNYILFKDDYDKVTQNFSCKDQIPTGLRKYFYKYFEASADKSTQCTTYNSAIQSMSEAYKNEDMTAYNEIKESIISSCSLLYEHENYDTACVKACLGLSKKIREIEGDKANDAECGLGTEITAWIMNILRWVKYIIPVIIILLSILDFIKALSSEKDDEMKKAQKRFVTRLIVAVLIFLMPLLIEFILGKMGFDASNCGIDNIGF